MTNKDNIKLWIDALRSGEYKQAFVNLHTLNKSIDCVGDPNSYCSLGVAIAVAVKQGILPSGSISRHLAFNHVKDVYAIEYICENSITSTSLPKSVADWLGVATTPMITRKDHPRREFVSNLNDVTRLSLSEIADALEFHYL